ENMLKSSLSHLAFEFAALSGLEAGDMAAEEVLRKTLGESQRAYIAGAQKAARGHKTLAPPTLAGRADPIYAYTEAVRIALIDELDELTDAFATSFADTSDQALVERSLALKYTYDELRNKPEPFLRVLTTGFIQLLDNIQHAEWDKAEQEGD